MFGHLRLWDTCDALKGMSHITAVGHHFLIGQAPFTPFQTMHCMRGRKERCEWDDFFFSLLPCKVPHYTLILCWSYFCIESIHSSRLKKHQTNKQTNKQTKNFLEQELNNIISWLYPHENFP